MWGRSGQRAFSFAAISFFFGVCSYASEVSHARLGGIECLRVSVFLPSTGGAVDGIDGPSLGRDLAAELMQRHICVDNSGQGDLPTFWIWGQITRDGTYFIDSYVSATAVLMSAKETALPAVIWRAGSVLGREDPPLLGSKVRRAVFDFTRLLADALIGAQAPATHKSLEANNVPSNSATRTGPCVTPSNPRTAARGYGKSGEAFHGALSRMQCLGISVFIEDEDGESRSEEIEQEIARRLVARDVCIDNGAEGGVPIFRVSSRVGSDGSYFIRSQVTERAVLMSPGEVFVPAVTWHGGGSIGHVDADPMPSIHRNISELTEVFADVLIHEREKGKARSVAPRGSDQYK